MVRILLCGDLRGRLKQLCDHVTKLHAKLPESQRFQVVFCVGEFSSEEMDLEVEPPVPVHFIDSGPAAMDLVEASPQGEEVGSNLHFLGHFGVASVAGLKVAFLSGRHREELFKEDDEAAGAGPAGEGGGAGGAAALAKYGSQEGDEFAPASSSRGGAAAASAGPSWEEIRAAEKLAEFKKSQLFIDGCYTPLALERLQEEIADSGGVDLLLTSEWPANMLRGVGQAWPEEELQRRYVKAASKKVSSAPVAALAAAAEPKYHACGLGGVFWRRPPWRHEHRGEVVNSTGELRCGVCRLVTLGSADGVAPTIQPKHGERGTDAELQIQKAPPQKWLHGLDLDPKAVPAAADDATDSPWSEKLTAAATGQSVAELGLLRPQFDTGADKEERRRWMRRFGALPEEMLKVSDKLEAESQPKEKKPFHKSLYKVSEKEKKRRKTGGDGHMPFHAKERMQAGRGG